MTVRAQVATLEAIVADPGGRAPEIDAIRGWAALSVVCFHVFWETFGVAVPWLRNPYTAALLAGHFDVVLFFILSGDALSFPFFQGGDARYLQRAALKRYPRLTVPIVIVTAVTAAAMAAGLTHAGAAGAIVGRSDWLGGFAWARPSLPTATRFALVQVYTSSATTNYLPFLWTMPIELLGSFVLILGLFVFRRLRSGAWIMAAIAYALIVVAGSYIGCFLVGMLLGKARADGLYARLPDLFRRYGTLVGIALAMTLAGHRQNVGNDELRGLVEGGTTLLFCIYANPLLVGILARSRVSQFLGRISYLLYLWHYTILVTMTSGLIIWAADTNGRISTTAAIGVGVATIALSVAVSYWTLAIEGWTRTINGWLLRALWVENRAEAGPRAPNR